MRLFTLDSQEATTVPASSWADRGEWSAAVLSFGRVQPVALDVGDEDDAQSVHALERDLSSDTDSVEARSTSEAHRHREDHVAFPEWSRSGCVLVYPEPFSAADFALLFLCRRASACVAAPLITVLHVPVQGVWHVEFSQ